MLSLLRVSSLSSDSWTIKQEKPKEKTVFNVKLESFDAAAKPKIIREVKAMIPNLTLIDVCDARVFC